MTTKRNIKLRTRRLLGDWLWVSHATGTLADDGRDQITAVRRFTQAEADTCAYDLMMSGLTVEYVTEVDGEDEMGGPLDPPKPPGEPTDPDAPNDPPIPPSPPSEPQGPDGDPSDGDPVPDQAP